MLGGPVEFTSFSDATTVCWAKQNVRASRMAGHNLFCSKEANIVSICGCQSAQTVGELMTAIAVEP